MSYIATIGFFDGVHRGHQHLIQQLIQAGRCYGLPTMLVTFHHHPRHIFAPQDVPLLLTSHEEKIQLLKNIGVDTVEVLHFNEEMATLTAPEFMEKVLKKQLHVKKLMIGYDHHFGKPTPQCSSFSDYQRYGKTFDIEVLSATALSDPMHISSSIIRKHLLNGDVESATEALGHPFQWTGHVIHGRQIGRSLGFPTANLVSNDPQKILPQNGVYTVLANNQPAMLNIGTRPTINNGNDVSIEVHIFNYNKNLYNQDVCVTFMARLRHEQQFPNEEELIQQLIKDREQALKIL